jgi:E3 ubiquitin-protein ligase DOA10
MDYSIMNENEIEEGKLACRICLDEDDINNLIYPCKCTGTSRYVHKNCLNEWRTITSNENYRYKCEICNYTYQIVISSNSQSCFMKSILSANSFYVCMNIFAFILGLILKEIDKDHKLIRVFVSKPDKLSDGDISLIYWIMSLSTSILILIIYLIGGLFTIRNPKLYCKLYNENKKTFIMFICLITMTLVINFYNISVILIEFLIYNISILHLQSIIKVRLSNYNEIVNYVKPSHANPNVDQSDSIVNQSDSTENQYSNLEVSIKQDMDESDFADL